MLRARARRTRALRSRSSPISPRIAGASSASSRRRARETARYRQLVVDLENNAPPPLFGAGAPDDLKLIVGVGPVLERMLQQLGVTTYRQIARWSERDIDEFDAKLPEFPGTHPPRRLGDAGARAAPVQVRRDAAARDAVTRVQARRARAPSPPDERAAAPTRTSRPRRSSRSRCSRSCGAATGRC